MAMVTLRQDRNSKGRLRKEIMMDDTSFTQQMSREGL